MDYLKERTFELFRYTIPGVFLLSILIMLDKKIQSPFQVYDLHFDGITTEGAIGLIVFGFITGLVVDQIGRSISKRFYRSQVKVEYRSTYNLSDVEKKALLREESPINFDHIENWNVYKGMCDNLSFGFLMLCFISIYKAIITNNWEVWLIILLVALISIISLSAKVRSFQQWLQEDTDAAVDLILDSDESHPYSRQTEEDHK